MQILMMTEFEFCYQNVYAASNIQQHIVQEGRIHAHLYQEVQMCPVAEDRPDRFEI